MRLRPYAAGPRVVAQVAADAFVLVWVAVWVHVGGVVHDAVDDLAAPGRQLQAGATGLADSLGRTARSAGRVPLLGDRLADPLRDAGSSATRAADAGARFVVTVHHLADVLQLAVALIPIAVLVVLWLPPRLRFALRSGDAARAVARLPTDAATRLLAVRALNSTRLGVLAALSPDPVEDVARGDPLVLARLAALERARLGLRR